MKTDNSKYSSTLVIHNDVSELAEFREFFSSVCGRCPMESGKIILLRAALDEALTNCVCYAYDSPGGEIRLEVTLEGKSLQFVLTDSGRPFNPLTYEPPVSGDDGLRVGGLGIPLIKKTFDSLTYKREGPYNILIMNKNI